MVSPYTLVREPPRSAYTASLKVPAIPSPEIQTQPATPSAQEAALQQVDSQIEGFTNAIKKLDAQLEVTKEPGARQDTLARRREYEQLVDTYQTQRKEILAGNIPVDVEAAVQARFAARQEGREQLATTQKLQAGLSGVKTLEDYEKYYKSLTSQEKRFLETPQSVRRNQEARLAALERVTPKETINYQKIPQEKLSAFEQVRVGEVAIQQETLQGTLYQKQVGTYKGVPQYEIIYRSPLGEERPATKEEQQEFLASPELHREVAGGGIYAGRKFTTKDLIFGNVLEFIEGSVPEEKYLVQPEGSKQEDYLSSLAREQARQDYITGTIEPLVALRQTRTISPPKVLITKEIKGEQYISGGGITPITPEDIFTLIYGGYAVKRGAIKLGANIIFHDLIVPASERAIETIVPRSTMGLAPSGVLPSIARYGLYTATTPITGTAYAFSIGESLLFNPAATGAGVLQYAAESPYEFALLSGHGISKAGKAGIKIGGGAYEVVRGTLKEGGRFISENIDAISNRVVKQVIPSSDVGELRVEPIGKSFREIVAAPKVELPETPLKLISDTYVKPASDFLREVSGELIKVGKGSVKTITEGYEVAGMVLTNTPFTIRLTPQFERSKIGTEGILISTTAGEIKLLQRYVIKTKVIPPEIETTTLTRKLFGLEPIYKGLAGKPKTYGYPISQFVSVDEAALIGIKTPRTKGLALIEGTPQSLDLLRDYRTLTEADKKLVERILTGGRPIARMKEILPEQLINIARKLVETSILRRIKYLPTEKGIEVGASGQYFVSSRAIEIYGRQKEGVVLHEIGHDVLNQVIKRNEGLLEGRSIKFIQRYFRELDKVAPSYMKVGYRKYEVGHEIFADLFAKRGSRKFMKEYGVLTLKPEEYATIKKVYSPIISREYNRIFKEIIPRTYLSKLINKNAQYFLSDVTLTQFYKGTKLPENIIPDLLKGYIPEGTRVTRQKVLTEIREVTPKTELPYDIYVERLAARETTSPLSKVPARVRTAIGEIKILKEPIPEERFYPSFILNEKFESPELKANLNKAGEGLVQAQEKVVKVLPKPLPKVFPKVPLTKIKTIKAKTILPKGAFVFQATTNIQEVGALEFPKSIGTEIGITKETTIETSKGLNKELNRELNKEISKEINKAIPREINKEISKEIPREIQKEMQKQVQKEIQKEIQKQVIPPVTPRVGVPFRETTKIIKVGKYAEKKRKKVPAYSVLIRRRGKFIPIAAGLPRGKAFKVLEKGLFQSIARTGKLVQAGTTEIEEEGFKPSPFAFREFKVRKGKRIETPDTFIQRSAYNLQSQAEKFELAQARILKQAGLQ